MLRSTTSTRERLGRGDSKENIISSKYVLFLRSLWLSPSCPQLPAESPSHSGESPTGFKRSLLDYLHHYRLPQLAVYVHRVQRCDFSHIK